MLYRASGNLLHYLPAIHRMRPLTERVNEAPKPVPTPSSRPRRVSQWKPEASPVERQAEPFIDICQAYRLWESRLFGPWRTFNLRILAEALGKKPWYRPLVSSLDP